MVARKSIILAAAHSLTHAEACRLSDAAAQGSAQTVILDLAACRDASTAAFARIVLLRRSLLAAGRDVWLAGLQGRPEQLFEVHRLDGILPRLSDLPEAQPAPKPLRHVRHAPALSAAC